MATTNETDLDDRQQRLNELRSAIEASDADTNAAYLAEAAEWECAELSDQQ